MKFKELLSQKPVNLALSAGYFGFFAHLGFVDALKQERIKIQMISGASAGALIGAIVGSEISTSEALKLLTEVPIKDIWDPGFGFGYLKWTKVEGILAKHLRPKIEDLSIKLTVSTFEVRSLRTKVFTSGPTAAIVRASCSPPGLVHPGLIDGKLYMDGGVADKPALRGMPQDQAFVSHFLMANALDRPLDFARALKKKRASQLMISFSDLIAVKPTKLSLGHQAYDRCLERTLEILNEDVQDLNENQNFHGDTFHYLQNSSR